MKMKLSMNLQFKRFHFEFNEGNLSTVQQYVVNQPSKIMNEPIQTNISRPIIRSWEEIRNNKHKTGLGYENDLTFHIPDYSKPLQFVSAGFLHENLTSPVPVKLQSVKCQYFQRVGHMEDQCFDLHPCHHCGKCNHASQKCSKRNKPRILKIHYGWINPWKWTSTTKKLHQSYRRVQS